MQNYLLFKNKHVRSIAWILRSPSMLSFNPISDDDIALRASDKNYVNSEFSFKQQDKVIPSPWGEEVYQKNIDWLMHLDENPQPLELWLEKYRSYRLGVRFEQLVAFVFLHLQETGFIENFATNLPIFDEKKQTLGEIDLLFYNPEKRQREHWEIAVKYYLFRPDQFNFDRWCGANGADWLRRKVDHLFVRQLGIDNTFEAKRVMHQHFSEQQNSLALNSSAFFKGMLFYPLNHDVKLNFEERSLINSDVQTGWWTYPDKFYQADPQQVSKWKIIEKLNWIVPQFYPYQDDDLLTPKEINLMIKRHFSQSKRSLHVARFRLDEQTQFWLEKERGFIVDPLWPSYKKEEE